MWTFSLSSPWLACTWSFSLTFKRDSWKSPAAQQYATPLQLEQRKRATKLTHSFLFWNGSGSQGPNLQEETRLVPGDSQRTEHPRTRGKKKKKSVRKRRKIWFFSKVILLWPLVSWTVRLLNSTGIQIILQLMKAHLQITLDNIKTHVTFCLLILLLLFLEQSHSWHEKRRYYCSRKHVTIKCWLEKDCLVLMEPETTLL